MKDFLRKFVREGRSQESIDKAMAKTQRQPRNMTPARRGGAQ